MPSSTCFRQVQRCKTPEVTVCPGIRPRHMHRRSEGHGRLTTSVAHLTMTQKSALEQVQQAVSTSSPRILNQSRSNAAQGGSCLAWTIKSGMLAIYLENPSFSDDGEPLELNATQFCGPSGPIHPRRTGEVRELCETDAVSTFRCYSCAHCNHLPNACSLRADILLTFMAEACPGQLPLIARASSKHLPL